MNGNLGKIIKLNRKQLNLKQDYLSCKAKISKSYLSRLERNKEKISFDVAKKIFNVMDLRISNEDIYEKFEYDFWMFYQDVAFNYDIDASYQRLQSYSSYIKSTTSYPKYLLGEMIFKIIYFNMTDVSTYHYLENYFEYLENYQIQLYYMYLGIAFRKKKMHKEALEMYRLAERNVGNDVSNSMLYYHISIVLQNLNILSESYDYIQKAKQLFVDTLNLRRLVLSEFQIAIIETSRNNYEKGIKIYSSCIKAFEQLNMITQIKDTYNNLLWTYIKSKQFDQILHLEDEVLNVVGENHSIYFFLSYTYYIKGDMAMAKKYIKLAKESLYQPTVYMEAMIKAFSVLLSKSSLERKEKYLKEAYRCAILNQDRDVEIFSLQLLIDFYLQNDHHQDAIVYQQRLLECYKEKC